MMKIRVSTSELISAGEAASGYIDKVYAEFDSIEDVVRSSYSYWEGEGQEAYVNTYTGKIEKIESALKAFRENIDDLRQIAGVYETAEHNAEEISQPLMSDVIV